MKALLVLMLPFLSLAQCPQISTQPQSQADCEGNSIRMIVISNGTQFQWEKKRPQDSNFTTISGATQANYQIMPSGNTSHPTGTLYRVKIGLGSCSVYSEAASITLSKINSILNPSICERGNGTLSIQASDGAMRFQWSRSIKGGPYQDISDNGIFSGSQQAQLNITNASTELDGQKIRVKIEFAVSPNNDNEGSTTNQNNSPTCPRTSSEVTLQIKPSPIPRHAAARYSGCFNESFAVNASGCSPYVTQWYDDKRNQLGTGARFLISLANPDPKQYFASCFNAGCESPLSAGTFVQAFPKPIAPINAGTPTEICPGKTITFKASGGSNNIWYANPTTTTALSTATNYTLIASGSGTLTRYVSQKINGCESERTAIEVEIRSGISCSPMDTTIIPPPLSPPPPPIDTATHKMPAVTLDYRLQKNCDLASYELNIIGCPTTPVWRINQQFEHTGNFISLYVPENMEIHIECPSTISQPLQILLPGLAAPSIPIQTNYQQFICEGENTYLSIQLPLNSNMVGWERNGHLFSQNQSLQGNLESGNYQAIIQRYACTYRSESIYIHVIPRPQAPMLSSNKLALCEDDSSIVEIKTSHLLYRWNDEIATQQLKIIRKSAGTYTYVAEVSDDGLCWSYRSKPLYIQIHATPESPRIILEKDGGFCRGDSSRLQIDRKGMGYHWSTTDTIAAIFVKQTGTFQVKWKDNNGCWSPYSPIAQTFNFPDEPQPNIQAIPNRQFCMGERIVVRASSAFAYLWSTRATSDSIFVQTSTQVYLKTQNPYGCWSPPSKTLELVAQENPWMPTITRTGVYFIQANPMGIISKFEWQLNAYHLLDTVAQLKIRQSGLYQVKAIRNYEIPDAKSIQCVSPFQKTSIGIPMEDPGIRVYPNPNKGQQMKVEIQEDLSDILAELYSLQGKKVKAWNLKNTLSINQLELSDLISGVYILTLAAKNYVRQQRIFIVSD
ncbi:Ig-like domain-containing protein [Aquirufa sp. 5-AUSEE-100C1]